MKNEFLIAKNIKEFISLLDDIIDNYPRKYFELRNKLFNTSYELLEIIYVANYTTDKKDYYNIIMSKISMLDFYLELSFKNKFISSKVCYKYSNKLLAINKMVNKWLHES